MMASSDGQKQQNESPSQNSNEESAKKPTNEPGHGWTNSALAQQMYPIMTQSGRIELYSTQRRLIRTSSSGAWSRTGNSDPNDAIAKSSSSTTTNIDSNGNGSSNSSNNTNTAGANANANTNANNNNNVDEETVAKEIKALMSQLCESFYHKNWQVGTGGGISIRTGNGTPSSPYRIFTTPSGIQKEDMISEDVIELDEHQNVVHCPKGQQMSSMTNLWFIVYKLRPSTACVLHTHSMYAQLATMLDATETTHELHLTHLEMIKGVGNHAYDDKLIVPIINNQRSESLLGPDLERILVQYPKCNAVLVRRHGVYVWGDSWEQAKTQLECFDYLFESAVRMKSMGVDCGVVPVHGQEQKQKKMKIHHHENVEQKTDKKKDDEVAIKQCSKKRSLDAMENGDAEGTTPYSNGNRNGSGNGNSSDKKEIHGSKNGHENEHENASLTSQGKRPKY